MKRLFAVMFVIALAAVSLLAKEVRYTACTLDKVEAVLVVDLPESASQGVQDNVKAAFAAAASTLSFDDLQGQPGYSAFVAGLTDESKQMLTILGRPAATTGVCK